jgi:hypothetical protein
MPSVLISSTVGLLRDYIHKICSSFTSYYLPKLSFIHSLLFIPFSLLPVACDSMSISTNSLKMKKNTSVTIPSSEIIRLIKYLNLHI